MSKQGSTLAGVMDAFSVAISIGLQYGVPLETFVSKFTNMRFEPAGMTDDPDIRMAASVMDYIFRRLALDFLPYDRRAELGIFTASERAAQLRAEAAAATGSITTIDEPVDMGSMAVSAPVEPVVEAGRGEGRGSGDAGVHRFVDGPARTGAGQERRRAVVLHVWHEDASGRKLLRLRGLRLHERLQLTIGSLLNHLAGAGNRDVFGSRPALS